MSLVRVLGFGVGISIAAYVFTPMVRDWMSASDEEALQACKAAFIAKYGARINADEFTPVANQASRREALLEMRWKEPSINYVSDVPFNCGLGGTCGLFGKRSSSGTIVYGTWATCTGRLWPLQVKTVTIGGWQK